MCWRGARRVLAVRVDVIGGTRDDAAMTIRRRFHGWQPTLVSAVLAWTLGCGEVRLETTGGAGGTGAVSSTSTSTSTGSSKATTTTSGSSSTGSTSSAMDFDYDADHAWGEVSCPGGTPLLYIALFPDVADGMCPPPPAATDDTILFAIEDWDGQPGVFTASPDGPVRLARAISNVPIAGTVTVHIEVPYIVSWISVDSDALSGTVELDRCFAIPPVPPCQ